MNCVERNLSIYSIDDVMAIIKSKYSMHHVHLTQLFIRIYVWRLLAVTTAKNIHKSTNRFAGIYTGIHDIVLDVVIVWNVIFFFYPPLIHSLVLVCVADDY